jgi:hypothetical protein
MYTASVTFFGRYRPAYFEGATAKDAFVKARRAVAQTEQYHMLTRFLTEALDGISSNCTSCSVDWGCYGAAMRQGPHDPWLDGVTRDYPAYPGLDYSAVANA